MILSIINVCLAIITVLLTLQNFKVMQNERKEKKRFKSFLDSSYNVFDINTLDKNTKNNYINLLLSNVGDNTFISTDVLIKEEKRLDDIQTIGTLRPSENRKIHFVFYEVLLKHLESDKYETKYSIPFQLSYFNKFYNTYLIEKKKLSVTIRKLSYEPNKVSIKTDNVYIESRDIKKYRSN